MNIRITLPSLLLGFGALADSTSATAAGPPAETVITNNEVRHWFAFRPARDDFQETILDCSRWVEAPTGRHGFVTAKGDRFVFEDGTPVRFWGAQMNLWSKEQTETTAQPSRLNAPLWRLKTEGAAPALLEAVTGELQIRCDQPKDFKAWTLDAVGKRVRPIPLQAHEDTIRLKLDAEYETVYYELSAQ